jgi:thiamine biosynthesis protein ThiS
VQIHVNGQARELPESTTVLELLEQLDLKPRRVAVERNKKIVRRASFAEALLGEGDCVEIVTLVGGG